MEKIQESRCENLGTRQRTAGEIIPVSVEQSATQDNDDVKHGAERAIDMNFDTSSHAVADPDGKVWIKINLDQVHCIQQVIRKYYSYTYTWTCLVDDCGNCVSNNVHCNAFTLTVTTEKPATPNLPSVTDCKYGDTVKLDIDANRYHKLGVKEIWIIGKQGRVRR